MWKDVFNITVIFDRANLILNLSIICNLHHSWTLVHLKCPFMLYDILCFVHIYQWLMFFLCQRKKINRESYYSALLCDYIHHNIYLTVFSLNILIFSVFTYNHLHRFQLPKMVRGIWGSKTMFSFDWRWILQKRPMRPSANPSKNSKGEKPSS